jgi:molybdopterin-binding protein
MLKINGISKRFRGFTLDAASFEVRQGSHFVLLGPTGSGKSLLLNIIAGVTSADSGTLSFGGADIRALPPEQRGFGVVYQDSALFPHMSVDENIAFPLRMRGLSASASGAAVTDIMERMNIPHLKSRRTGNLSGGERQRTALARALITRPRLLLLDEPLSSLDYVTRREMITLLREIKKDYGPTVFHITHDFEEALSLADTAAVIKEGRVTQTGTVKEIFSAPADIFTAAFTGAKNIYSGKVISDIGGSVFMTDEGVGLFIGRHCPADAVNAVLNAEEVILSKTEIETSARNMLKGKISRITFTRGVTEVEVDAGIRVTSYITARSLEEMGLSEGMPVYVIFKGNAVHIF